MGGETFPRLKDFIISQIGVDEEEVTATASLQHDLGIYGDDAVDFIVAFAKEFRVDVSKFMASDYFDSEGIDLFSRRNQKKKKELTIGDLEKAIRSGRLDEEVINS